ncbi:hypothetical protein [Streptomyces sp. NPDC054961]
MREGRPPGAVTAEPAAFPRAHQRFAPDPAFPRAHRRFAPDPAFQQVRPGSSAVRATAAEKIDDGPFGERFAVVCAQIAEQLTPVTPEGLPASGFLFPVDGAGTWFRWSG